MLVQAAGQLTHLVAVLSVPVPGWQAGLPGDAFSLDQPYINDQSQRCESIVGRSEDYMKAKDLSYLNSSGHYLSREACVTEHIMINFKGFQS